MKAALLILVLGDSVSLGWSKYTDLEKPPTNCQSSAKWLAEMGGWTPKHYSAIVFNCGLWDIKERPVAEYEANLRLIVARLRPHADRLYFCTITPGRIEEEKGRTPEAVAAYNAAATKVMRALGVSVIDLHSEVAAHPAWWNGDIHYTEEGYKGMAEYVKHALTP